MALSVYQSGFTAPNPVGSGSPSAAIFSGNVLAGDLVIILIVTTLGDTVSTLTSPMGTPSFIARSDTQNQNIEAWEIPNATATSAANTKVTATVASGPLWSPGGIEVAGSVNAVALGGTAGPSSPPATIIITPHESGDLIIAGVTAAGGISGSSPGSPWTLAGGTGQWAASSQGNDAAWQVVASTSTVTASWVNAYLGSDLVGVIVRPAVTGINHGLWALMP